MPARENLTVISSQTPKNNPGGAQNQVSTLKENSGKEQEEVRTLLSWKANSRPFKERGKEYFKTLGAILFFVSVVLLFIKEWLLIGAIWAFFFITYVLSRVPPEDVEHKITTQGITTGGKVYLWRELSDFWFTQNHGQTVLNIDILPTGRVRFLGRLLILLGDQSETKVREILAKYLSYREIPEKNWMDNASGWLARKIPLEKSTN
ncbi:hypothetical protein HY439_03005 [Candidatus Microgenomates bacterium]|nr:hypothetical protein [Candidatus Microgenomates bacterium]